ncbi:hypothetical protein OIN60_21240 [Paenibacillus sp. P96]|uniref:Lipoprotein n=1 Tax=Paenibacillus zeirhizosphaerae TaxID=2987519 RepID=A0ABT9FWY7_9BACL|nr:hypothetical protein [Paenibacillus sp. P96]MDP4099246.1 hypothetical protein [Paenibacillus sp. P96]
MSKRIAALMLTMILVLTVALVGCSKKMEPKEAATTAATQATTMKSYAMSSKFTINELSFTSPEAQSDPSMDMALNMLKNAEMTVDGVYQLDPMQTEMTVGIHLKGDMAMDFTIPMVLTQDKMYVKIPSIPFFPMPEGIVGKFLELDPKELAEQTGEEFNPAAMDQAKAQQLSNEVINAIMAEYDASYFTDIDPKDAALPEGIDAKQVVQFKVTNDNFQAAATTFVNKALPKVLDIMSKDEYAGLMQIEKSEIEDLKSELASNSSEVTTGIEEAKKYLKVNQFDLNTAINKDNFPVYQSLNAKLDFNDPETKQNVKLSVTGSGQYTKINEKQTFAIGIPSGDQVVTMDQLQEQMSKAGY